jgi:hypothetical protein
MLLDDRLTVGVLLCRTGFPPACTGNARTWSCCHDGSSLRLPAVERVRTGYNSVCFPDTRHIREILLRFLGEDKETTVKHEATSLAATEVASANAVEIPSQSGDPSDCMGARKRHAQSTSRRKLRFIFRTLLTNAIALSRLGALQWITPNLLPNLSGAQQYSGGLESLWSL